MAAVAAPMYSNHHQAFLPSSSRATTSVSSGHSQLQQQEDFIEDQYASLFCRALYDYEAQDASALSFRRNDIIEVLTQQPSGWWDGLLGEERGWFPSNYVVVISDEEAEQTLSGSETSNLEARTANPHDSILDISHAMMRGSQAENEEWLDSEMSTRSGLDELAIASLDGPTTTSDFWLPEVTPDGQVSL